MTNVGGAETSCLTDEARTRTAGPLTRRISRRRFDFISSSKQQRWKNAQGTAQISGTVKDQSGAVLPGVEVTATNIDTGVSRMTVTNETGSFVLPNLPIGPYRLEGSLPGFRTFAQTGIVLQVGTNPVVNPVLEVGRNGPADGRRCARR